MTLPDHLLKQYDICNFPSNTPVPSTFRHRHLRQDPYKLHNLLHCIIFYRQNKVILHHTMYSRYAYRLSTALPVLQHLPSLPVRDLFTTGNSSSFASIKKFIMHLQRSLMPLPSFCKRSCTCTMAILMISAAVPGSESSSRYVHQTGAA